MSTTPKPATRPTTGNGETPDRETVFELLSNKRRRYALRHLLDRTDGEAVELRELAEQIAAWEHDTDPAQVSYDQRRNVYTALQQTHLPTMDDAGVVDYSARDGTVEATASAANVLVYLENEDEEPELPWSRAVLGAALVVSLLTVLRWIGAPVLSLVPAMVWAGLVSVAFLAIGVGQFYAASGDASTVRELPPDQR